VDKSITFRYCTVISEVLRPLDVIFWKEHKLYVVFALQIF